MRTIRQPAVAGTFYPASAAELAATVDGLLEAVTVPAACPKAIIAPHAGYVYSGPVAASVYARLRAAGQSISRVVLLGPSHRVGFRGIAATRASHYRTPLGDIEVDTVAVEGILDLPMTGYLEEAHQDEHSLEVHLPFLQRCLTSFRLVPLVVGDAGAAEVAAVLDRLWGGPETLIVVSSDLSHYQSWQSARSRDQRTSERILQFRGDLKGEDACGCRPINGLLRAAAARGLRIEAVDLRNSGDTAGGRDRVVGYGAYALWEQEPADRLSPTARGILLAEARRTIAEALGLPAPAPAVRELLPPVLLAQGACFVTLELGGQLRGCIGSLMAHRPLIDDLIHNARAAAFEDPRFPPLRAAEFEALELHVSVLSAPVDLSVASRAELLARLRPGVDGLIIEEHGHRATFLPSVWQQLPRAEDFLRQLRRKAGLSPEGWSPGTRVQIYTTEEFG